MKVKRKIKDIILDYCEGRNHLEFNREDLNEMAERIEEAVVEAKKDELQDMIDEFQDRLNEL